ncbi:MAG: 1-deoxy-D-xylulose-5-phosphate reductoisomerase [Actinobacteria bacterium]|nr:1-deoxy-D-xylulose-5-phosphate reductoisomerase [Actinomycetota bacterium]
MKNIILLGSTGSIGRQVIQVVQDNPDKFKIIGLAGHSNYKLIEEQALICKPKHIAMYDESAIGKISGSLSNLEIKFYQGIEGISELVQIPKADLIVNGMVGSIGLLPTIRALEAGKTVALANKETLVAGGDLIMPLIREKKLNLLPIDSEHSAIFQCLNGENHSDIKRIIITGSGGPFRGKTKEELKLVTKEQALKHPRWKMGSKITIDSATLMNKGLEAIEAHHLFGVDYETIEVIIHPESIIHSMVEFIDGSIKAHLGFTDMRIPIQYALSYPLRLSSSLTGMDFAKVANLSFEAPDLTSFPCLGYAFEAGKKGKTYPAVLNAANETAVSSFLNGKISFLDISNIVYEILSEHKGINVSDFETIRSQEEWARNRALEMIKRLGR